MRRRILTLRRAQSFPQIEKKSREIEKNLSSFCVFNNAKVILFYLALKDEVQTEYMIKKNLKESLFLLLILEREKFFLPSLRIMIKNLFREDGGFWDQQEIFIVLFP